jgi:predicted CoA-binding protein
MDPKTLLASVRSILVIDWPSRDVPDSLALAAFHVTVHGGPGPEDYFAHEIVDGNPTPRRTGRPPDHADLVYSFRPLAELPQIIATAQSLGAKAIWTQSGLSAPGVKDPKGCWLSDADRTSASNLIRAAGLTYIFEPCIADVARALGP